MRLRKTETTYKKYHVNQEMSILRNNLLVFVL